MQINLRISKKIRTFAHKLNPIHDFMKKGYLLFTLLSATVLSVFAQGSPTLNDLKNDRDIIIGQLHLPTCPDFKNIYEPPVVGSDAWKHDSTLYFKHKEPRLETVQKEAGTITQQNRDSIWANLNEQYFFVLHRLAADSVMNAPFLSAINWNTYLDITLWDDEKQKDTTYHRGYNYNPSTYTPNTTTFPKMNTLELLCERMKSTDGDDAYRTRLRPFVYFEGWYGNTHYSKNSQNYSSWVSSYTDSYPSGHAYFRGLFGKCMEIVDPEHNEAIQNMLDEWLHCRLQKGAHWASDLTAGEKLGKMAFDSAMTVPAFRQLIADTRKELRDYRSQNIPVISEDSTNIELELSGLVSTSTKFTLDRTFYKDGYFNTLCLPFSLTSLVGTPLEGADVYEFESATKVGNALELYINPVTAITAGTPYLIKWEKESAFQIDTLTAGTPLVPWQSGEMTYSMTFNNVTITASTGATVGTGVQFVGSMGQSELPQANNYLFVGANNTLYWPNTANKLKGFRAYFVVNGSVAPHSTPARLVIRNTPTGLPYTGTNEPACKRIENGQLYIIRNGVKYNAQGQTIK